MRRETLVSATALLIGLGGVARAGSGALVPPMRIDVGAESSSVHGTSRGGGELMIGLDAATLYPKPLPIDLGVGFIDVSSDDPGTGPMLLDASSGSRPPGPRAPEPLLGWYAELSGRISGGDHWRTWVSGRGERFHAGDRTELGGVVRVSAELWAGVALADGRGVIFGVVALGAWAEAGMRGQPDGSVARVAATGLSVRVPLIIAD